MDNLEYFLGASYYPEWWDESRWRDDFGRMREVGFNCVRMGFHRCVRTDRFGS